MRMLRAHGPAPTPARHGGAERTPLDRREWLAGALLAIGLCWPFVVPSLLPLRWFMFLPFALAAGILRQRSMPRPMAPLLPLWGFFFVVLLYVGIAATIDPLSPYGRQKVVQFVLLGGAAYLAAMRQAPLTPDFVRGLRAMLLPTLGICLVAVLLNRDLFLSTSEFGVDQLRSTFSTTGLPLVIAMAATSVIPSTLSLGRLLPGTLALLALAVLEVLVRGRFHAMLLSGIAVALIMGPPWRHLFWRAVTGGAIAVVAIGIFVNVLPLLGESFTYLDRLHVESLGGRAPLYLEAWHGFWAQPLGQGIGAFERLQPIYVYPHNIVLEVAFELGIFGLLSLLALYIFALRRVWQLWLSPPHRMLGALLLVVFLHTMKAGDFSMFAFHWVYLYLLLVATPVAPAWPLRGERAESR